MAKWYEIASKNKDKEYVKKVLDILDYFSEMISKSIDVYGYIPNLKTCQNITKVTFLEFLSPMSRDVFC